jgi:hypothetical protein
MTPVAAPTPNSKRSPGGSPTGGYAADAPSPTPPNVADSPQRAAAYIRESTEEQGQGFSPTRNAKRSPTSRPRTI